MASGELGHDNLRRAVAGLSQAVALDGSGYPDFVRDVIDSGRVQKFEYCVELFWKQLRSSLLAEGLEVPNSPRATFKAALDRGFLRDAEYQQSLDMVADRNTCSHVYRQALIPGILARLADYCRLMEAVAGRLPVT